MGLFDTVLQDVRYGVRALRRQAGFTAVSMLALAIGIGVNTVVFTAYKAVVARPIDGRDPGTLVNLALRLQSGANHAQFSYPDYEAYRDGLRSLSGVIAFSIEQLTLTGAEADGAASQRTARKESLFDRLGMSLPSASKESVGVFVVSENYFSVLGVAPVRGRAFDAIGSSELAASPAVLISENFWQRRFGGDPAILGRTIRLNGATFTIAGITPANFTGTNVTVPAFWLPMSLYTLVHPESNRLRDREDFCCRVFGRLAPNVSMGEAQAEATVLASHLRTLHASDSDLAKEVSASITPGSPLPGINTSLRITIVLIMTAALMVLVIACANAAGLQLARGTTRQQELGMRLSLGATRWRLVRQLVTESACLGLAAGSLALPVTWMMMRAGAAKIAEQLPAEFALVLNVNPDPQVFAYVAGISLVAGILFGLAPALASSRTALFSITRGGATSLARSRLRQSLIAAQVAVSLTLMIAGALLVRSATQAVTMETGYDGERVIDVIVQFPEERIYTNDQKAAMLRDIRSRVAALPGVAAITSARAPNDNGVRRAAVSLTSEAPSRHNARAMIFYTWVEPNYFDTLGIPLLRGRGFSARGGSSGGASDGPPVGESYQAIVSESAARHLWPGQDPIGRGLRLGTHGQFHRKEELLPDGPVWQVIGVARDTRGVTLDGSDSRQVYVPMPENRLHEYPMLVRTTSDPALTMRTMRAIEPAIAVVDPGLSITVSTLQAMLRRTDAFLAASISAAIASTISVFGLLLASMGIYSTVSYDVVLRTREVGIRMAIGARKRHVLALVMRGSLRPVIAGLLLGIVLAVGASRLLRGVLYGLGIVDVIAFAGTSLLFLVIALAASWLPSRRAMRVDPLVALRHQ